MNASSTQALALRRQLLLVQSQLQRLQIQREWQGLVARSNPLRLLGPWVAPERSKPLVVVLALATMAVLGAWRRWTGRHLR
jgi:hypothetical protein